LDIDADLSKPMPVLVAGNDDLPALLFSRMFLLQPSKLLVLKFGESGLVPLMITKMKQHPLPAGSAFV
jgi:hypothetical protein